MGKIKENRFTVPTRKFGAGKDKNRLSVIILAGTIGYRMKSYGPQCLFRTSDKQTILDLQVQVINMAYPNSEITIVTGFEADKVIKKAPQNLRIVENQLYEDTNTIEEARLALNSIIDNHVLIIHSDIIFNFDAIDSITKNESCILYDKDGHMPTEDIGVTIIDNKATIFSYGVENKWCYIAYLQGQELDLFRKFCRQRDNKRLFVHEGLNYILNKRGKLQAVCPEDMYVRKITAIKDIT